MNGKAIETFRFALLITGLVLLVVFGTRAASQASDKTLAGASHKNTMLSSTSPSFFGISPFGGQAFTTTKPEATTPEPAKSIEPIRAVAHTKSQPAPKTTVSSSASAAKKSHTQANANSTTKKSPSNKSKASSKGGSTAQSAKSSNQTKHTEDVADHNEDTKRPVKKVIHRTQNLFVRLLF